VNLARAGMIRLGVDFPENITMDLIGAKFQYRQPASEIGVVYADCAARPLAGPAVSTRR
jgi:hypothetical protein